MCLFNQLPWGACARTANNWYVPVSYWLLSVPVVVLLGAEVFVGFSTLVAALVYVVFVVVVGGFLFSWGAAQIEVTGTVLKAGGDILSLSQVSEVLPLDDKEAALLRGPRADPAAHLLRRPYLKRAVYIGLPDSRRGAVLAGRDAPPQRAPQWH